MVAIGVIMVAAKSVQISSEVWLASAGLVAVLMLGAVLIAWISRWHRRLERETVTAHDQLTTFRLLYERGELSEDEYQRIRQQLLPRLREESGVARPASDRAPSDEASPTPRETSTKASLPDTDESAPS